jgi:type I restriction enzyme M protein
VVSLPAGVFNPYSGVKTSILFLDRQLAKKSGAVLFVKIENDGFGLGAQRREIDKNDLPDAARILREWKKSPRITRINADNVLVVSKEKLAENGEYNLTGDRYRVTERRGKQKWPMVRLGDVCEINPRKSEVSALPGETIVSFLPMTDIGMTQDIYPKKERTISEVYKGYSYFRENDILVAKVTPCFENGKSGIARNLKSKIGFGTTEIHVIRPSENIIA